MSSDSESDQRIFRSNETESASLLLCEIPVGAWSIHWCTFYEPDTCMLIHLPNTFKINDN